MNVKGGNVYKNLTEIAKEAMIENPGWAIRVEELVRIAGKYKVDPTELFKEMVRLVNERH